MPKPIKEVTDPKALTDRIAQEENTEDREAIMGPLRKGIGVVRDYILGTPQQNREAAASMRQRDIKSPDTMGAKINRVLGYGDEVEGRKSGGKISTASKRADGIAQRGKTRGTIAMCKGGMAKK